MVRMLDSTHKKSTYLLTQKYLQKSYPMYCMYQIVKQKIKGKSTQTSNYIDFKASTMYYLNSNKYAQHGKIYMSSPMYAENSKFSMMRVK